jgi:hypothetical protein
LITTNFIYSSILNKRKIRVRIIITLWKSSVHSIIKFAELVYVARDPISWDCFFYTNENLPIWTQICKKNSWMIPHLVINIYWCFFYYGSRDMKLVIWSRLQKIF